MHSQCIINAARSVWKCLPSCRRVRPDADIPAGGRRYNSLAAEVRRQARALAERPSAARGDEEDLFSTIVKVVKQLHERLVEDCRLAGPALHSFGAAVAADACRRALPGPLWVRMRRLAKMADIARHATMAGARRLLLEAEGWLDEHPPEGRG